MRTQTHTYAHVQTRADILLNGRALLLPQSMEYHICLFTPRFLSLNSINIYIAAEGVGSPSCSGGKLSLDENELQSSLPRHRLVCLYLHYPAIPQLPLSRLFFFFFSVHITICSSSPLMWLFKLLSLSKVNWLLGKKKKEEKKKWLETLADWAAWLSISIWIGEGQLSMSEEEEVL